MLVRRKAEYNHPDGRPKRSWLRALAGYGSRSAPPEIILLDHGLYIQESEAFRRQYAQFWKSMFLNDTETLKSIAKQWGVNDVDIFASATLMRPFQSVQPISMRSTSGGMPKHALTKEEKYALQMKAKERVRHFFADTEKIPQELILVGRNMNIVRALNKQLGSPVNRIRIMAEWAAASEYSWTLSENGVRQKHVLLHASMLAQWKYRLRAQWDRWRFRSMLWLLEFGFLSTRFWQMAASFWSMMFGYWPREVQGFEERLDEQMMGVVEKELGIKMDPDAFNG